MKRTLFLATSAIATAFANGESMKLVNVKTGFVVVEFNQGKVAFHDRFLETEMKETGILIPPALASEYEGKEVIYLGDPLFEKAFIHVHFPHCFATSVYQWQ
jgi:hypothetical protein